MTSFFVTGAAGFVGQAFLEQLGSADDRAVCLDISPPPAGLKIKTGTWIRGNILDRGCYVEKLWGIDVVVHLAGRAHYVPRTQEEAEHFWKVNLMGTKTLVAAAIEQGVRRFVHISTVAVLSPQADGIEFAYASSKRAAEQELIRFGDRIEVVVVRPTTVYGPNDKGNVYKLIRWIDRGLPAIIGSGENKKSLVFSGNLAQALFFLSKKGKSGDVYVVTDGVDMSMREIVLTIARSLGRKYRWPPIPASMVNTFIAINEWGGDRFGLPKFLGRDTVGKFTEETIYDPSLLFSLGFEPLYGFKEGIRETVQWYRRSAPSRSA